MAVVTVFRVAGVNQNYAATYYALLTGNRIRMQIKRNRRKLISTIKKVDMGK